MGFHVDRPNDGRFVSTREEMSTMFTVDGNNNKCTFRFSLVHPAPSMLGTRRMRAAYRNNNKCNKLPTLGFANGNFLGRLQVGMRRMGYARRPVGCNSALQFASSLLIIIIYPRALFSPPNSGQRCAAYAINVLARERSPSIFILDFAADFFLSFSRFAFAIREGFSLHIAANKFEQQRRLARGRPNEFSLHLLEFFFSSLCSAMPAFGYWNGE